MDELAELRREDPAINVVREKLRRLLDRQQAGRRLPAILIQGETGTGKGLRRQAHPPRRPRGATGRSWTSTVAAIPETLLEAELFGFERGAFTDARRAKPGLFQAAHRGHALPRRGRPAARARCRPSSSTAIEERSVRRLGGTRSEPVDACVISATNTDLAGGRPGAAVPG